MPFFFLLILILLIPVLLVFFAVSGVLRNLSRAFNGVARTQPNVKHRRHIEELIDEAVEEEFEYSEEDIIEVEFEEIEDDDKK